jgi:uncharacterized coiled-coil protein SlyX
MSTGTAPIEVARQARRLWAEHVARSLPSVTQSLALWAQRQVDAPAASRATIDDRRDLVQLLARHQDDWRRLVADRLARRMLHPTAAAARTAQAQKQAAARGAHEAPAAAPAGPATRWAPRPAHVGEPAADPAADPTKEEPSLSLVDDETIERGIHGSRLGAAMADLASWELVDLRARIAYLEGVDGLPETDLLMPASLGQVYTEAWSDAGIGLKFWRLCAGVLHEQLALACLTACQEVNRKLVAAGVMPEVRLQGRKVESPTAAGGAPRAPQPGTPHARAPVPTRAARAPGVPPATPAAPPASDARPVPPPAQAAAEQLTVRLGQVVTEHLPTFAAGTRTWQVSPELATAIQATQRVLADRADKGATEEAGAVTQTALLEELGTRKLQLKRAATSQEERATIEIVDLLFQAILAEDRIPASVRVLFARLQMPVLRVAVSEPDFFAASDHPARRLIDRMGACAMGFDRMADTLGDALGREIRRVVQVVEAYPDTGRRVFQTVLTEFEKFIEKFMREQSDAARTAVSLAEQVEQRETLVIQYTIELRRMLDALPVHEGVREFLFQVWADVLAITSLRHGVHSTQIQAMKRAAADLIWAAGAKATREERAEVIRRLPQLLKAVREGMASAGIDAARQEARVRELNNALAAAFTAKSAAISRERLAELTQRLETLDELLPDSADLQLDEAMMLDLSDQETAGLEVASEPGAPAPSPQALARARELQVGSWHQFEFRGRSEPVQLAWQGLRRQLTMFVSGGGRCVLVPLRELATYLDRQALRPAEEEPLTARATRNVLARLDANPSLLVS